jgi:hypothetical protein
MTFAKLIKFCDKNGYEIERSMGGGLPYDPRYVYKWTNKKTGHSEDNDTVVSAFEDILGDIEDNEDENHDVCQAN